MCAAAVRLHHIGKRYRIGERAPYKTLRGALAEGFSSLGRSAADPRVESRDKDTDASGYIWALKDVSFDVQQGEVVGIIGRNGAGKTTLLKVLARITHPTEGQADIYGRVGSLLEVGTGFHPELTGRENVYLNGAILGMKKREVDGKFDEIVDFADLQKFIDTPVKFYSSGMHMRLAFSVAAHLEPEILLVDEVLAVGDVEFQKKCLGKMGEVASGGRTVLFVSHNMSAVESLCRTAIFLNQGNVQVYGAVRDAIAHYLGQSSKSETYFPGKSVKRASASQMGSTIEIEAEYEVETPLVMPSLGFVISDYLGNPVCGSNPVIDNQEGLEAPRSSGVVKVRINYPKLLNGTYRVSLWFGNGREDFFVERDCLTFEVVNMVNIKQLSSSSLGSVAPQCEWFLS
jgi:lipopolysaccharide transport system ATP-binding protein